LKELSLEEMVNKWNYLYMAVQETLRLEPPARRATPQIVTEDVEIMGKKILKNMPIMFHLLLLHRNPDEYPDPLKFIPERFDPESKHFLNAEGKKRKPASFSPFLGGRRICVGKTFAENIIKSVVPLILSKLEFEFVDPKDYLRKPPNGVFAEPKFNVIAKIYD